MNHAIAYARAWALQASRGIDYWTRLLRDRSFRCQEGQQRQEFAAFCGEYLDLLSSPVPARHGRRRNALLIGFATRRCLAMELALAKALELAGYRPIIVTQRDGWLGSYFGLIRSARVAFWHPLQAHARFREEALAILSGCRDVSSLSGARWRSYRAGRGAVAAVVLQRGAPFDDWSDPALHEPLVGSLSASLAYIDQIDRLINQCRPALACVSDKMQSPAAEVVEVCAQKGIETIAFFDSYRTSTTVAQRVTARNAESFSRTTLSTKLWRELRECDDVPWCPHFVEVDRDRILTMGKHYSAGGSIGGAAVAGEQVISRFGFDPAKKTAGIYPQPFWDASFLWGKHLANHPAHWLVATTAAAIENARVNWFIKLHPSYTKRLESGCRDEPPEVQLLRRTFGTLPRHVVLIPPAEKVDGMALFDVMDVCVTGSSTVALEASMRGIPTLTSSIGEHDRHGFTLDFETLDAFLVQLRSIDDVRPALPEQVELAKRYALGALVLRPCPLTSIRYEPTPRGRFEFRLVARSVAELAATPDIRALVEWLGRPDMEDFRIPATCPECALTGAAAGLDSRSPFSADGSRIRTTAAPP